MDVKEYILSGILELYVSGALSESESKEVEAMAAKHPEVKTEIEAIQSALNNYTSAYKKNPRPELRQSVLDKIDEAEGTGESTSKIISMPDNNIAARDYRQPGRMNYLMAAVWAFLALNIIGNVYFYTKLQQTESQMTAVVNESNKLKLDYEKIKRDMDRKSGEMKMVMNRNNKIIDLKGMEIAPQSSASVYWNPGTKKVMLNVDNLPMPPSEMQYQLWALKDGKPIDAGVFDMTGDMHMMPVEIAGADAFAITLEKKGGSPTPDLSRLYAMGKI